MRYQVASPASEANAGKRRASIRSSASISEVAGSSSNTTITTGVRERDSPATASAPPSGSTSSETGETTRNSTRNSSGAGEMTVTNERTGAARA